MNEEEKRRNALWLEKKNEKLGLQNSKNKFKVFLKNSFLSF